MNHKQGGLLGARKREDGKVGFRVCGVGRDSPRCDGHGGGQTKILTWEEVISEEINGVCNRPREPREEKERLQNL